jgi:hypothetical protein
MKSPRDRPTTIAFAPFTTTRIPPCGKAPLIAAVQASHATWFPSLPLSNLVLVRAQFSKWNRRDNSTSQVPDKRAIGKVKSWYGTCPITRRRLACTATGTLATVATPLRGCKNLVNGLVNSRHSLGESINGKTSPLRVCARGDIVSSRLHAWVFGLRKTIPTGSQILALATWE